MPPAAAGHRRILQRAGLQGAGRRRPPRGPHARRARPAQPHARPPGDGHSPHAQVRTERGVLHRGEGQGPARLAPRCGRGRPRPVLHRSSAQRVHRAPARLPRGRCPQDHGVGQGPDRERLPCHAPEPGGRRGLRRRVPEIDDRINERRTNPQDDVTTRLLELEVDGERLTPRQLRAMVRNLITGGLTTTSQLLGNLLHQLFTVPGLEDRLRSDPDALPRAIEESLRLAPPVMFIPRGCVRETDVDGTTLHAGQRVVMGSACANRDETVFPSGDDFDVDRDNVSDHLTFGYGPHFCPGAPMARAVARIAITAFLQRFPTDTVRLADGFEFENVPAFFETGPARLPVEISG
ncbi:MAG: cytochrome P450 [Actinobacteria bacterium]|nr:MAG: cytochrome P450 [Actinomycetota bacterium]